MDLTDKEKENKFDVEDDVTPDRLKMSLISMQKRFIDLEFAVSEISSKLKEVDVKELELDKERMEELEDLILIEQAGIIELKKILQNLNKEFKSSVSKEDVSIIKSRVKRIENLARAAAQMVDITAELPEEGKIRLKKLEKVVAELKSRPTLEIDSMELADIQRDMNVLGRNFESMQKTITELESNIDTKIRGHIKGSQIQTADFDYVNSKLKSIRSAIETMDDKHNKTNLKISSLEQKIDSMEKTGGGKVPKKLLEVVKDSRKGLEVMKTRVDSVERVVSELSKDVNEVERVAKRFEGFEKLTALEDEVDKKLQQFRFMKDEIKSLSNRVEIIYDDLDGRLNKIKGIEREVKHLDEIVKDVKTDMNQMAFSVKKARKTEDDVESLRNEIDKLGEKVNRIPVKRDTGTKSPGMAKEMTSINDRLTKLERVIKKMGESVDNIPKENDIQDYDNRIAEMIDKLVYLETRISAMESMLQTSSETQAVVLE